jgi:ABC-type amino acid transport substrate-binding protein
MICKILDILGTYKNEIISICGLLTVFFAYLGLKTWRRQLLGDSRFKLTKTFLKAAFKLEISFDSLRSPAIFNYEYPKDKDNGEIRKDEYVYNTRWNRFDMDFASLEDLSLEIRVELGKDYEDLLFELRKQRADLLVAMMRYLDNKKTNQLNTSSVEYKRIYQKVVGLKDDDFGKIFHDLINDLDIKLRPYVDYKIISKVKSKLFKKKKYNNA